MFYLSETSQVCFCRRAIVLVICVDDLRNPLVILAYNCVKL